MTWDAMYFAMLFNSSIRMMAPILFVALGSAFCVRVRIFNIGLEGMMLTGAFAAIVANYFTGNVMLSLLSAMTASTLVALLAGVFMVKFKGAMLVVGIAINILMSAITTFLMQVIFNVRGAFLHPDLVSLPRIDVSFLERWPVLERMFMALTWLDLFAFAAAIILFFVLFRTVTGFRIRSTGINKEAAESLGIKAESLQIRTVAFSGLLSGIGGCLLVMGGVTMFMQDITAGRGFLALAAGNMGAAHPLGVIASSAFFGFAQALSNILQNTAFPNELTLAVPFAATIVALMLYNYMNLKRGRDIG
ncbi:MAG: ABC transporter permease [Oscillospiraceae bacterium]|nr:ABC transporter permease [Oscillospiraceae bacterium]